MSDEYINILTPEGILTSKKVLKSEAHRLGLWHASVHVWITNTKGEVLLQKRASNKDTFPNLWDVSVAGHLTFGDTPLKAALREVQEEIGITLDASCLEHIMSVRSIKNPTPLITDREFHHIYIAVWKDAIPSIADFTLQQEEVAALRWISITALKQELKKKTIDFVPHEKDYLEAVLTQLDTLIPINL